MPAVEDAAMPPLPANGADAEPHARSDEGNAAADDKARAAASTEEREEWEEEADIDYEAFGEEVFGDEAAAPGFVPPPVPDADFDELLRELQRLEAVRQRQAPARHGRALAGRRRDFAEHLDHLLKTWEH